MQRFLRGSPRLCHAPRERVSWNILGICQPQIGYKSRSTWACELKSALRGGGRRSVCVTLHVSVWVEMVYGGVRCRTRLVTLHVSVWVEMVSSRCKRLCASRSRSTWACELKWRLLHKRVQHRLSRSTWACELKSLKPSMIALIISSRSTWACELKYARCTVWNPWRCHAPRERVSWNLKLDPTNVEYTASRSTWACELKCQPAAAAAAAACHAPRERVSWNF